MAVKETEIWIVSHFEEFSELRAMLRDRINSFAGVYLKAIEVNDNVTVDSPRPPLGKCISDVKRAKVMILLVGDSYGCPLTEEMSYAHLVYRAAVGKNSSTIVLPFFIGPSYAAKMTILSHEPNWQNGSKNSFAIIHQYSLMD